MAGQPRDSTFVLIMKGSMDSSAMRIVAIDEENKYRTKEGLTGTVGLQQLTTYPVDSVAADTLPDAAEYIPIRGNKFYAVKISAYKVVDDLKVPVTYYGCLKVRTHINPTGSLGNVGYVFGKVELVFNYGEARNWTKE
jgi:hypothetical protein